MRLRSIPNASEMLPSFSNYVPEPGIFKERWSSYFGNYNEIHLEIGSGKGEFIITLAQNNPGINYIAVERCNTIALKLLRKIPETGLRNLAVTSVDAEHLEEFLREGEIGKLYLNFSDPWPKKRHAKRRLTSPKYLRIYERILKDGAMIEFKTDNRGFFDYSLEQFEDSAFEMVASTYDLYNSDLLEGNIPTEYEMRFHGMGVPINKLIARLDKKKIRQE
ncbi:MAG: tRNA (guanosine(46)-N7)-methyltransferase TrmB [Clostridiaceae bacterium]|jgi:tRNA (guanine-N7-)-methyltransferase|nr:tRNA (guanosine(46)-N7)-methyltransferase TrmB [Clostridiaceae bacterium]